MSCNCQGASGTVIRTPEEAAKFDELERYIASLQVDRIPDRRRGSLIQILHRAQNLFGYLPEEVQGFVNIKEGESTPDGRFFLGALRCVGACSLAPVVMVNDKVYGNMTADKVADILRECGE